MRVLIGRPIRLRHVFVDSDEETPLTVSDVVVNVTNSLGVSEAPVAATLEGDEWTATLPALPLGEYVVSWDTDGISDRTNLEVVGSVLFTVPFARNSDDYLKDTEAFPAAEIISYRDVVEREFERITGRSFTTRLRTLRFVADGSREYPFLIPDPQGVEFAEVDGEAQDAALWHVEGVGKVIAPADVPEGSEVVLQVRYGHASPPADVRRVGAVRLRSLLAAESSGIPDRATTWQPDEGGTFRLATPGQGKWRTGIPEVDSVLADYAIDTVVSVFAIG